MQNYHNQRKGKMFRARWNSLTTYINVKQAIEKKEKKTLSLDGEKPIPAVGAECCFIHETLIISRK
jgi:hypothetical protein